MVLDTPIAEGDEDDEEASWPPTRPQVGLDFPQGQVAVDQPLRLLFSVAEGEDEDGGPAEDRPSGSIKDCNARIPYLVR